MPPPHRAAVSSRLGHPAASSQSFSVPIRFITAKIDPADLDRRPPALVFESDPPPPPHRSRTMRTQTGLKAGGILASD